MGITKAQRSEKRKNAEARQAKYDALTLEQKLASPTLGARERTKLLAKQNQKRG